MNIINKFFNLFKFKNTYQASNLKITVKPIDVTFKSCILHNNIIKAMNAINPQITGRLIENIIFYLCNVHELYNSDVLYALVMNDVQINNKMIPIINANLFEFKNLLYELNCSVKEHFNQPCKHIIYYHNDDLSFKKSKCCKVNTYNCICDLSTNDTIIDIKVVKNSVINEKTNKLSNIGLKYYNQLMTYACGFWRKYDYWPSKLIVFNCYTCEFMYWVPTEKDYFKFYNSL